jgi:hypothetical protein
MTPNTPLTPAEPEEIIFTDRYQALGIPYPNPKTVCKGDCEGMGIVPVRSNDTDPAYRNLWKEAHKNAHSIKQIVRIAWKYKDVTRLWKGFACDGWHFVKCPKCNGTGKEPQ